MTLSYDLTGEVVIITGGGAGIGRAMAIMFADAGASVVVVDVDSATAHEVAAEIIGAGGRALPVVADVSDEPAVAQLAARTLSEYGRVDILCNNAGIVDNMALPAEVPTTMWDRVIAVNLTGPFLVSRAVLPSMLHQGKGAIINVASVSALRGGTAGISYTAAKHGLVGLTRSLAHAYRNRGIRANAICPGGVDTGIESTVSFDPVGLARNRPVHALAEGRRASPDEIASVALFLSSPAASFVNGAVITVDAGWCAA
jgi:NAD(P)-dependent dehydrogenase (short-subunit alcohol dehydrogenase family)